MTHDVDYLVVHAIHRSLDIFEVANVNDMPIEYIEPFVTGYVQALHDNLVRIIAAGGVPMIAKNDHARLAGHVFGSGTGLPLGAVMALCKTICDIEHGRSPAKRIPELNIMNALSDLNPFR